METRKLITLETASAVSGIPLKRLKKLIIKGGIRTEGIIEGKTLISESTLQQLIICNKLTN